MSLRLVKQQLAALSKDQGAPENPKEQPQADKKKSETRKLKNKIKKKLHKREKAKAQKALSEEDIRKRNLEYYIKTAGTSKSSEAMVQVTHRSLVSSYGEPYTVGKFHRSTLTYWRSNYYAQICGPTFAVFRPT